MLPTPPIAYALSCHCNKCPLDPSDGISKPLYTYFIKISINAISNAETASSICEDLIDRRTLSVKFKAAS